MAFLVITPADGGIVLCPIQELALLMSQMGGEVNVAMDASPSTDLNQVMSEIREHYESVIGKNRKELEAWYQNKVRSYKCLGYSHFGDLQKSYIELIWLDSMTVMYYNCWVKQWILFL